MKADREKYKTDSYIFRGKYMSEMVELEYTISKLMDMYFFENKGKQLTQSAVFNFHLSKTLKMDMKVTLLQTMLGAVFHLDKNKVTKITNTLIKLNQLRNVLAHYLDGHYIANSYAYGEPKTLSRGITIESENKEGKKIKTDYSIVDFDYYNIIVPIDLIPEIYNQITEAEYLINCFCEYFQTNKINKSHSLDKIIDNFNKKYAFSEFISATKGVYKLNLPK